MTRRLRVLGAALTCGLVGTGLAGCGSASSTGGGSAAVPSHTTTLPSGQLIVEAADRTAQAPGFRISATINLSAEQTTATGAITGTVERRGNREALDLKEDVSGHMINLQIRAAGETLYMSGIPGESTISHGRPWIQFDLGEVDRANGLGDLQTEASSDPARYLTYLRAVGGTIERIGTATIRGVSTTHYHAVIDLNRYPSRAPAAERAKARQSIATLESSLGGDTLPVDVWIGANHDLRQMQLHFPLCADGQSVSLSMTMELFDYGQVPAVTLPAAADTDNLTSSVESALSQSQTATTSSSCGG